MYFVFLYELNFASTVSAHILVYLNVPFPFFLIFLLLALSLSPSFFFSSYLPFINGKLAFVYNTEFDDDGGEREFNTLVVGPEVYEKIKEMFGKGEWKERFTNWFKGNTRLNVDDVEMDDFKGIFSDYVDPSWADDENWDY